MLALRAKLRNFACGAGFRSGGAPAVGVVGLLLWGALGALGALLGARGLEVEELVHRGRHAAHHLSESEAKRGALLGPLFGGC